MSWQVSITSIPKEEVAEKVKAALDAQLTAQPFDSWDDDVQAQQDAAVGITTEIADSGSVGDGPFNITLNGHRKRNPTESYSLSVLISSY
jgi:hypothetical protein